MASPTKATAITKVDRRTGNRRLTGTDMNPTSALCLTSASWAGSLRSQGARARGVERDRAVASVASVASGVVASVASVGGIGAAHPLRPVAFLARPGPGPVRRHEGPSPIDGELTPAARRAVVARSRISRATSN